MTATDAPAISVIVASHQRPRWLRRCLTALAQLDYPNFEIIIAADDTGLRALADHAAAPHIKTIAAPEANISRTRNLGLARAAGEIVAFIDDDAVPEPLWLRFHAGALAATGAAACVGYVRGRNGISFQSRAESVDAFAETHREQSRPDAPFVPESTTGRAVKLVGTNFTVRRDILCEIGGFDEAFRYYLDDTDLSLRLAAAGHITAVAPLAEVHHATAPSARRTPARRPRDLFDIGRSTALFLRKHSDASADLFERIHHRERGRLLRHLVAGTCEPRDIARLSVTLEAGWNTGKADKLQPTGTMDAPDESFSRFPAKAPGHHVIGERFLGNRTMPPPDQRTSLFRFSRTTLRHRVQFVEPGIWLQTGGQFGPSLRNGPVFRWCRFAERLEEETARVAMQRGIGEN
ncbi:MAG: glycosyltransferase family 2 protein [Boseongicola sp.]|nr:glycosyltransferase family 2 protein [Boseongicola sp.]NNJ67565.1 glycosyltransferase family 2 protein [Boseongicola sp.]